MSEIITRRGLVQATAGVIGLGLIKAANGQYYGQPSLKMAAAYYANRCVCGYRYDNNCAHFLSNAMILVNYNDLKTSSLITKGGRCSLSRPIRAKDMRAWFKARAVRSMTNICPAPHHGIWAVYQERADGQGHVLLFDTDSWSWFGTGNYPDWPIQEYYQF